VTGRAAPVVAALSQRQNSGARPIRPIKRYDCALREIRCAFSKSLEQCLAAKLRYKWLASQQHYAGPYVASEGEYLGKVKVISQQDAFMGAGVLADFPIPC
jgi:hypothetical protein